LRFKAVLIDDIKANEIKRGGFKGVKVMRLITKADGASNFIMRCFDIEPGGKIPYHNHDWEHEIFVLRGSCQIMCENEVKLVHEGTGIFIPPNAFHSFHNVGAKPFRFLCLIPATGPSFACKTQ